jgi:hypothetical protein
MSAKAESVDLAAGTDGYRVGEAQTRGQVHAVALSPCARQTTLDHVDYTDGLRLETGPAQKRTAEDWARALRRERTAVAVATFASRALPSVTSGRRGGSEQQPRATRAM